ncbi:MULTISPECIES: carbohydrate kinase [unclassified Mesorhizobium]|uniref:carbohydrate kinase n=1 Tax=unclassified Mesorhizobium TaxID=325217 RepID=UPI0008F0DBD5|nr:MULTISPECIES: carbohydrate kinase [unclassified Mesorhizobium]RJG43072.1 winged helix-turn-helix transcriptional regulator [Mesorhizobium sp. DCY119]SFT65315.1 pseudouridine kinase [Mesorhizobium sp. YR577]
MDDLGAQEQAVLELIAANPFAGQQDIATALGLARSTVAAHIVQLVNKGYILGRGYVLPASKRMICIGGAVLDRKYHAKKELIFETSNPVDGYRSFGGVARNVAENLVRLGVDISFVSIVGDDETGRSLVRHLRDLGADVSQVITTTERPTAEYAAILDPKNDLALGIADMEIFDLFSPSYLDRFWPHLAAATWVFIDCNLPAATIESLIARKQGARFKLAVDTVSSPKSAKLPKDLSGIDLLFTNHDEANTILGITEPEKRLKPKDAAAALRAAGAGEVIVTMGAHGYAVATEEGVVTMRSVPARPVDITGAGDAMIAGTMYRVLSGDPTQNAARTGALLATLTTESESSVHPDLSARFLAAGMYRIPA